MQLISGCNWSAQHMEPDNYQMQEAGDGAAVPVAGSSNTFADVWKVTFGPLAAYK